MNESNIDARQILLTHTSQVGQKYYIKHPSSQNHLGLEDLTSLIPHEDY